MPVHAMERVQELALLPHIAAAGAELIGFGLRGNCRQVQDFKAALFLQVAGEIVLMNALHDENDACDLFVVGTAQQGGTIPLDRPLPDRFGMRIVLLERIVDDHQVAAQSSQRALDRGGVALTSHRRHDLPVGVTRQPHGREGFLIERIIHQPAEIAGVRASELVRI